MIGVRFSKLGGLAAVSFLLAVSTSATSAASLFATLDGAWHGGGKVEMESGSTEAIKCKGYYNAKDGGLGLGVAITCANASVKINMRAALIDAGGAITGTWEEREFNQSGNVSGKATADRLTLTFSGGITGTMSISTAGKQQSVSISTGGPGFTGVNLEFSKG